MSLWKAEKEYAEMVEEPLATNFKSWKMPDKDCLDQGEASEALVLDAEFKRDPQKLSLQDAYFNAMFENIKIKAKILHEQNTTILFFQCFLKVLFYFWSLCLHCFMGFFFLYLQQVGWLWCTGFSLRWLLLLQSTGSRARVCCHLFI